MLWLILSLIAVFALLAQRLWRRQQRLDDEIRRLRESRTTELIDERRLAASQERQRLLADLHDDIGAKLLNLVHTLEKPEQADLVRAIVQDFRDIVSRTHQCACSLQQALGQIREETEARLDAAGSTLDWQPATDIPDPDLNESQVLHLFRIAREAITNALHHGQATHIRVRVKAYAQTLYFDVTDDGPGLPADELIVASRGTDSMKQRAEALRGSIDWTAGSTGGTKVVLQFPLPPTKPATVLSL